MSVERAMSVERGLPIERGVVVDMAGALLMLLMAAWTMAVTRTVDGNGAALRDLVLLSVGLYTTGRVLSALDARLIPFGITLVAVVIALANAENLLASPIGSPLGYANATAAFYALAAGAAALYAAREPDVVRSRVGFGTAFVLALVPWSNGSQAGAVATLVTAAGVLTAIVGGRTMRRLTVLVGLWSVLAAFVATVGIGAACRPAACRVPSTVVAALSRNRPRLWHESLDILGANPVWGVGPGGFAVTSPTALGDPDLAWVHGELLELGVEMGLPGLAVGLCLVVWLYARLWVSPLGRGVPIAAAALTGLLLQAQIDYVLHSPVVVGTAVLVLAAGVTPSSTWYGDLKRNTRRPPTEATAEHTT